MVTPKKKARAKPQAAKPIEAEATQKVTEKTPEKPKPGAPKKQLRGAVTDIPTKVAASVSLMAVILIGVLVNILAARHYKRWDMTKGGDFTLSDGTIDTLRALDEPIHILVLVSRNIPIGVSVQEILDGYKQHSNKLDIEYVDPDREQAHLLDLQKKYGLVSGESGSRGVIDAAIIVVQGERHQFIQPGDLVAVDDPSDLRTRPRLEYAITSAIRNVRSADAPVVCFTTGHNELPLDVGETTGMAELRDRLQRNNYEVATVFEPTSDAPRDPLKRCSVVVVATPRSALPKEHSDLLKSFIEGGGNALIVVGPIPNKAQTDWVDLGVNDVLALAGVKLSDDYVHELDPSRLPRDSDGTTYFADVRVHPVSERLAREEQSAATGAVLSFSASLGDLQNDVKPEPLLMSSSRSFGIVDYWQRYADLKPSDKDHQGPLVIAIAAERPPKPGQKRGARIVVAAANNLLLGMNWSDPSLQGNMLFVQGAFSWLASHERFLDLPDKPLKTTGLRITEEAMAATFRYVVILIPGGVGLIGIAIFFVRRRRPGTRETEET